MSMPAEAPFAPPRPRRRWLPRVRYSLRTLLLGALLIGSGGTLWRNWGPWALEPVSNKMKVDFGNAEFSPDGNRLAATESDGTVRVWNMQTSRESALLREPGITLNNPVFSPDNLRIATTCSDKSMRIWDAESGAELALFRGEDSYSSPSFSSDGRLLAAVCNDRTAQVWEVETKTRKTAVRMDEGQFWGALISNDGSRLFTFGSDSKLREWNVPSGGLIAVKADAGWITNFHAQGERVAFFYRSHELMVWDTESGAVKTYNEDELMDRDCFLALTPDGRLLVTGIDGYGFQVWDAKSGAVLTRVVRDEKIWSLGISPDGRWLVTGENRSIRVWNVESGVELQSLMSMSPMIMGLKFTPDGRHIFTWFWQNNNDGGLHVWFRRRPEYWWGLTWLPEFWLALTLAGAFGWSVWRDRRELCSAV